MPHRISAYFVGLESTLTVVLLIVQTVLKALSTQTPAAPPALPVLNASQVPSVTSWARTLRPFVVHVHPVNTPPRGRCLVHPVQQESLRLPPLLAVLPVLLALTTMQIQSCVTLVRPASTRMEEP